MRKKVVVIGSGFGGLAAANRLQAMGFDVTIVEKRDRIGGRAYQLQEAGYTFDMGPSLITAPQIIDDVFAAAGARRSDYLDLIPLDPFYRIYFHDGSWFDYTGDRERTIRQMEMFNPRDAARFDTFIRDIKPVYEAVITEGLGARPFDTIRSMVDFAPRAIQLKAYQSVARFASRYFEDFRHQFVYSFHPLFIGGNPFRSPSVYVMIPYLEREQGVWFTRGGMYSLVEAFGKLLVHQGGHIRTRAEVRHIIVENGQARGVLLSNDERVPADLVVSNADVAHTYKTLIDTSHRRKWTDRKIDGLAQSMSCFLLYLGVRKQYDHLAHHTIILSARYRQLVTDIFDRKVLPDDFSMYLHAPTKTDPSMAPAGCESLYVLVPVANLQSGIDWEKETPAFTERILTFLEKWGLEGLRDHIEVLKTFTPLDFRDELNAYQGNAFGIEPRLTQTAYFRPHNHSEDVSNLYLVGAGTHPGAGVPGVLLSAEATAWSIRRDLGLPDVPPGVRKMVTGVPA